MIVGGTASPQSRSFAISGDDADAANGIGDRYCSHHFDELFAIEVFLDFATSPLDLRRLVPHGLSCQGDDHSLDFVEGRRVEMRQDLLDLRLSKAGGEEMTPGLILSHRAPESAGYNGEYQRNGSGGKSPLIPTSDR